MNLYIPYQVIIYNFLCFLIFEICFAKKASESKEKFVPEVFTYSFGCKKCSDIFFSSVLYKLRSITQWEEFFFFSTFKSYGKNKINVFSSPLKEKKRPWSILFSDGWKHLPIFFVKNENSFFWIGKDDIHFFFKRIVASESKICITFPQVYKAKKCYVI